MTDVSEAAAPFDKDAFLKEVSGKLEAQLGSAWREPKVKPDAEAPTVGPYALAACVLSWFRFSELTPLSQASPDALAELRYQAILVQGSDGETAWTLPQGMRIGALAELRAKGLIDDALRANRQHLAADDGLQEALLAYLKGPSRPLADQRLTELAATMEVCGWLEAADFPDLPPRAAIAAEVARKSLLEPFEQIARDEIFRGRKKELRRLRDYVGVLPPRGLLSLAARAGEHVLGITEKRPLLIYGPGGVGKSTLVARFILEHAQLPQPLRFPFAYLDFDRPEINENEPLSLLCEAVRQLGVQYPAALAHGEALQARWREEFGRSQSPSAPQSSVLATSDTLPEVLDRAAADFSALISTLGAAGQPVVLVLDTIEELQFAVGARLNTIWPLLMTMREHAPRLRVILAGRGEIEGRSVDPLPLPGLDRAAAIRYLRAQGVPSGQVAERLADRLGGSPLSLKLAAELAQKTSWTGADLPLKFLTFDAQLVQRQLYRRVLQHLHQPDVRKLAYPGLILRRVTAELILHVLAEPCGLDVSNLAKAQVLMDEMGREMSLVTRDADGALRHRQDLRLLMLELIRGEDPRRFDDIQRRAVAFYASRTTPVEKAEEIYHRLARNEPREAIDPLWIVGVAPFLMNAADEFHGGRRAYLARRLGLRVDSETAQSADLEDWESLTARSAAELLSQNQFAAALTAIRGRDERTAESPLVALECRALVLADRWDEAFGVLTRGFDFAALEGRRVFAFDLALQFADLVLARRIRPHAEQAASRLAQFDEELGRDTGLAALSRRLLLAELTEASDTDRGQLASRLIAGARRVETEALMGEGALGVWIGAAIARLDPVELARILAIVGVPRSPETELRRVASELARFDALLSTAQDAPAGALAREFEVPPDGTLTRAWTNFLLRADGGDIARVIIGTLERSGVRAPDELLVALSRLLLASLGVRRQPRAGRRRAATLIKSAKRVRAEYDKDLLDRIASAFMGAFSQTELGDLVSRRIGLSVEAVSLSDTAASAGLDLVLTAASQDWLVGLVTAALEARPTDGAIAKVAAELGIQSLSLPANEAVGALASLEELAVLQGQVCLIEIDGEPHSTGFLIDRDLVLTTIAVAGPDAADDAADIRARFDFRLGPNGVASSGVEFSARVLARRPDDPDGGAGLGYALLRLNEQAGILPIGRLEAESSAALRGWISLPSEEVSLSSGDPIVVIHHLRGAPLDASTGTVREAGAGSNNFTYRVETGPGSGGAPCFSASLTLIGLHLGKMSNLDGFGCRISAIVRDLETQGIFSGPAMA